MVTTITDSVLIVRYLTIAGLSILSWDTLLTIDEEVRYIWRSSPLLLRIAYAANRYGALIMLAVSLIDLTPSASLAKVMNNQICYNVLVAATSISAVVDGTGNAVTLFRVFTLWGSNRKILLQLLAGAAFTVVCNIVLTAHYLQRLGSSIGGAVWDSSAQSCILISDEPHVFSAITWFTQIVFDSYAVVLVFVNALYIPRRAGSSIWTKLHDHKISIILCAFFLRLVNIVLAAQSKNFYLIVVAVGFIQPMICTANSRLILELYKVELGDSRNSLRTQIGIGENLLELE